MLFSVKGNIKSAYKFMSVAAWVLFKSFYADVVSITKVSPMRKPRTSGVKPTEESGLSGWIIEFKSGLKLFAVNVKVGSRLPLLQDEHGETVVFSSHKALESRLVYRWLPKNDKRRYGKWVLSESTPNNESLKEDVHLERLDALAAIIRGWTDGQLLVSPQRAVALRKMTQQAQEQSLYEHELFEGPSAEYDGCIGDVQRADTNS